MERVSDHVKQPENRIMDQHWAVVAIVPMMPVLLHAAKVRLSQEGRKAMVNPIQGIPTYP